MPDFTVHRVRHDTVVIRNAPDQWAAIEQAELMMADQDYELDHSCEATFTTEPYTEEEEP